MDMFLLASSFMCAITQGMAMMKAAENALRVAQLQRLYHIIITRLGFAHATITRRSLIELDAYDEILSALTRRGLRTCDVAELALSHLWHMLTYAPREDVDADVLPIVIDYNIPQCADAWCEYIYYRPCSAIAPAALASIFKHAEGTIGPSQLMDWTRTLLDKLPGPVLFALADMSSPARRAFSTCSPVAHALLLRFTYEHALLHPNTLRAWIQWDAECRMPTIPTAHDAFESFADIELYVLLLQRLPCTALTRAAQRKLGTRNGALCALTLVPLPGLVTASFVTSFSLVRMLLQKCTVVVAATHRCMREQFVQLLACAVIDKDTNAAPLCELLNECLAYKSFVCVPALRAYIQWLRGPAVAVAWARVFDAVLAQDSSAAALVIEHMHDAAMWAVFQTQRSAALTQAIGVAGLCLHALSTQAVSLTLLILSRQSMLTDAYTAAITLTEGACGAEVFARPPGPLTRAVCCATPDADPCHVCWETMLPHETVDNLACGHSFHMRCLSRWFRNSNRTCPLCRAPHVGELRNAIANAKSNLSTTDILFVAAFEPLHLFATL